jgi:hypothetical protein
LAEFTRTREAEPEPQPGTTRLYEPQVYEYAIGVRERQRNGRVVVRDQDRPWDMHRQANSKRFLSPLEPELQDTITQDWEVFVNSFSERSGKHRHQGGVVIFVLEGKGYTIVDGERHDWEAGDLLLLPMKPGGVEHQHFCSDPSNPVKWIAFLYWPFIYFGGMELTQLESSPQYERYMAELQARKNVGKEDGK